MMTDLDAVLRWIVGVLDARGAREIESWRMLEYWVQVELFRSLSSGGLPDFAPVGCYEIPYATDYAPRTPGKRGTKWADLVAVSRDRSASLWFELKDLGRSETRLTLNAKSAAIDLAALSMIQWAPTLRQLRAPGPMVKDAGRGQEWIEAAASLEPCTKVVGVTVAIFPQGMTETAKIEKHLAETYRLTLRHQATIPEPTFRAAAASGFGLVLGAVELRCAAGAETS